MEIFLWILGGLATGALVAAAIAGLGFLLLVAAWMANGSH